MIICNPRSLAIALLIAALPVGFALAGGGGRGGAIGAGVGAAGMGSAGVGGCAPERIRFQTACGPTSDPREEPGALAAHAGICAGGEEKSSSLPRPYDPSTDANSIISRRR